MKTRTSSKFMLAASALLLAGATPAFAQRPTSSRRIPISKEAPPRTDTVTVYRTDTLRVEGPTTTIHDTVTVTNTVTRVDTVVPPPRPLHFPRGVYFGVGAGVNLPEGSLYVPNAPGNFFQAQLGYQAPVFGVRIDGSYSKLGEDSGFSGFQADPDIINANGDVKIVLPILQHLFGQTPRFGIYGLGGVSWTRYKNLPMVLDPGVVVAGSPFPNVLVGDYPWTSKWGWNAGGGASLSWNRTEVFAESRVISFSPDNAPNARQIPIMLGINWYF